MHTKEKQYQIQYDTLQEKGARSLGITTSHMWRSDPKHLSFMLARYKFCAKMLAGKKSVLEVGCGDGFAVPILLQHVGSVHGIDFDPIFINNAKNINVENGNVSFEVADIIKEGINKKFDAAYSLDVIEHIRVEDEEKYLRNILATLSNDGVLIIGTPNITSAQYASIWSQEGHINMKDEKALRALLEKYFANVFIFSMNDEVIHTGYYPMAHYLFAVAAGKKSTSNGHEM